MASMDATINIQFVEGPTNDPEIIGIFDYYENGEKYPGKIRVLFRDGNTEIYDKRVEQPAPIILENIKIIRRMKQGYVNKPARRRGRG